MRNKVILNEHGFSIESYAKLFRNGKWNARYLICRRVRDIEAPVIQVYKPALGFRGPGKYKYAIVLENYVGIEKGFEVRKHTLTLALILKNESLIMAFLRPQQLSLWELWFKEVLGPSSVFFMQVKEAPKATLTRQHICREVRVHVTENKFAIVAESIPKLIAYFPLTDIQNISCMDSMFFFTKITSYQSRELYALISGQIEQFYSLLLKSKRSNNLRFYLRRQNTEGLWMLDGPRHSNPSKNLAERGGTLSLPRKFVGNQLNQPVSELVCVNRRYSGNFPIQSARNSSKIEEPLYANLGVDDFANDEFSETQDSSDSEHHYDNSIGHNTFECSSDGARYIRQGSGLFLHTYENVPQATPVKWHDFGYVANNRIEDRECSLKSRPTSSQSYGNISPSPDRGRTQIDEAEKYENWEKAKQLIASFKRPVYNSNNIMASSSELLVEDGTVRKVTPLMEHPAAISIRVDETEEPVSAPGLCKPQNEALLIGRPAPVVRSNLLSSVVGSFTRYDGERATHEYPRQQISTSPVELAPNSPSGHSDAVPPDVFESAVMKGRERLMQSERRNSSFSNCTRISSIPARSSFRLPNQTRGSDVVSRNSSLDLRTAPCSSGVSSTGCKTASPPKRDQIVVEATIEIHKDSETSLLNRSDDDADSLPLPGMSTPPPLPPRNRTDSSSKESSVAAECVDGVVEYCDLAPGTSSVRASPIERRPSYAEIDEASTLATKIALQRCRRGTFSSLNGTRNKSNSLSTITVSRLGTGQIQETASPSTVSLFLQKCRKPWKKHSSASTSHSNLFFE
ncbi:hypothetical protein QR680_002038 [Steinernema hermaphroditum]|uniref:PH domain-containing protein n=1 Tax=Steinernema hermaphroditum TaxID=289476 RepID=A0AA39LHD0_9BILA|nr:hypothetical protein QR680_002038 [Steinernema hermaphroditum]